MHTCPDEAMLIGEYEKRLAQVAASPAAALLFKWAILAAIQGDRTFRTPGEPAQEITEEEEERIHEEFRKARAARRAAAEANADAARN